MCFAAVLCALTLGSPLAHVRTRPLTNDNDDNGSWHLVTGHYVPGTVARSLADFLTQSLQAGVMVPLTGRES